MPLPVKVLLIGLLLAAGVRSGGLEASTLTVMIQLGGDAPGQTVISLNQLGTSVPAPVIALHPMSQGVPLGGTVTLRVVAVGFGPVSYQWLRNGRNVIGATQPTLTFSSVQPHHAGIYSVLVTDRFGSALSQRAILAVRTTERVAGAGFSPPQFRNILHPSGRLLDQVLLIGTAATITAGPGRVTRISFVDMNDDIVQVEFSGRGSLTVTLADASGPALPRNYIQEVPYMRGHPSIIVEGSGPDTVLSIFSVGSVTAVDPRIFRADVQYGGRADLARLAIHSLAGTVSSLLMGNVHFFDVAGLTGIFAPGVTALGEVRLHDITAFLGGDPALIFRSAPLGISIAGGSLNQVNARPVQIGGIDRVTLGAGTDSHGLLLPALPIAGRLFRDGIDVTDQVVDVP